MTKLSRSALGISDEAGTTEEELKALKVLLGKSEGIFGDIAEDNHTEDTLRIFTVAYEVLKLLAPLKAPQAEMFLATLRQGQVPNMQSAQPAALGAGNQGGNADQAADLRELQQQLDDAKKKYQQLAQRVAGDVDDQGDALSTHDEYMKRAKTLHDNATTDVADVVPDPATYVEKSKLKPLIDAVVNEKTKLDAGLTSKAKEHKAGHLKNRTSLIVYTEADFDSSVVAVSATLDEKLKNLQEAAK